jgi:hypothetical protein
MDMPICIYESFEDLKELVPGRCSSEKDFQDYTNHVEKQIKQLEAQGATVHRIIVKPAEFKAWLKTASKDVLTMQPPQQRSTYAVAKFTGTSGSHIIDPNKN